MQVNQGIHLSLLFSYSQRASIFCGSGVGQQNTQGNSLYIPESNLNLTPLMWKENLSRNGVVLMDYLSSKQLFLYVSGTSADKSGLSE